MLREVLIKILSAIPTLFGVTVLAFVLIRLVPGDPVMLMLGERGASPEVYAELQKALGLDKPWPEQYFLFIGRAVRGDLGSSIFTQRPVWDEFTDRFPATLELSFLALFWAIVIGIPIGIIAAVKRGTFWDYFTMSGSLIGYSMPIFWWGLILILVFSIFLGWTPVSGRMSAMYDIPVKTGLMLIDVWFSGEGWPAFKNAFLHMILPSVALATIPLAAIARMTRSSLLEVLREDYVRTAKAKGLTFRGVVVKHALRNALIPIVTVVGLMGGTLLTGAILTETIFSWPGLGKWLVTSVGARDYPVIQGGVLLCASLVIFVNLLVDIAYLWINPFLRGRG